MKQFAPIALLGLFVACQETREGARQDAERAEDWMQEEGGQVGAERQDFETETRAELDRIGERLREMRSDVEQASGDTKVDAERKLEQLEQRHHQAVNELERLPPNREDMEKTKEKVEDLGHDVDQALSDFGEKIRQKIED